MQESEPGVTVTEVAQRYGVPSSRCSAWRKLARKGSLRFHHRHHRARGGSAMDYCSATHTI